ncbi:hypothetical protein [Thermomonospora umbrina]|uniref:Uncharacterized protein n=1 Tax=Thermomonospora umbrina TaxID=111806 RepID=A0A3D9SMZ1_9ACTN|nr:hypothetical protein [Thermomonospora umbrina]REE97296.1 hypothetical protein DFJ69_2762 [Thermomonospora umbrina]
MGHLYNESIRAETDTSGRLTAYEWRGLRYTVHEVLKAYGSDTEATVYRMRVSAAPTGSAGPAAVAVAEIVGDAGHWRLRHHFSA